MDFRDQSSSVFSSSTSGGVDRRRENGASTVIFSPPSLVFDHHHLHRHHHHQKHHHHHHPSSPPSPKKEKQSKVTRDLDSDPKSESESEPDHDPDPVSVSIAVAGPISVKSSPRTPLISKSSGSVRYRECLKNHAASSGGHVVDGCGEFMPSGEEGSLGALKCAACNCHRNFHRKEVDDKPTKCRGIISPLAQPLQFQKISLGSPGPTPFQPTTMMAFGSGGGGGGATESSSEDINLFNTNPEGSAAVARQMMMNSFGQSKKRFRTKFTQDQKEKMLEFADKIGWRFQKQDEADIQVFCSEVGIQREVLKVWMHNNKHSMKMKQQQQQMQQQQQQQELQQE